MNTNLLNTPLITVLMPCYNAMPFLTEALESIINQSYTNLEILCINDGSTDTTGEVLEKYAKNDDRIKVIHNEQNIKLIQTLNKGIDLAKGDYIARMDADDISMPNRIEVELKFMQEHPEIDILSTGSYNINEEGKIISKKIPRAHGSLACLYASFFYVPIGHPELLIKTSVLKNNKFLFEPHVLHTEDYELWARLLRKGYNLCNIDDVLLCFRINSQSVSRKYTKIQDENFVECAKRHYSEYLKFEYSSEIVSVLTNRLSNETRFVDFKKAIKIMRIFKINFIKRENITEIIIIKEIEVVYKTHLFDVCIQAIKKAGLKTKLFAFYVLILNVNIFFNKQYYNFFKEKIHRKFPKI